MASYNDTNLSNLVINHVPNEEVFNEMKAAGAINPNELYLVGGTDTTVKYTAQALTEDQKAQARSNIGVKIETWTFTLEDGSTVNKKVVLQ